MLELSTPQARGVSAPTHGAFVYLYGEAPDERDRIFPVWASSDNADDESDAGFEEPKAHLAGDLGAIREHDPKEKATGSLW